MLNHKNFKNSIIFFFYKYWQFSNLEWELSSFINTKIKFCCKFINWWVEHFFLINFIYTNCSLNILILVLVLWSLCISLRGMNAFLIIIPQKAKRLKGKPDDDLEEVIKSMHFWLLFRKKRSVWGQVKLVIWKFCRVGSCIWMS